MKKFLKSIWRSVQSLLWNSIPEQPTPITANTGRGPTPTLPSFRSAFKKMGLGTLMIVGPNFDPWHNMSDYLNYEDSDVNQNINMASFVLTTSGMLGFINGGSELCLSTLTHVRSISTRLWYRLSDKNTISEDLALQLRTEDYEKVLFLLGIIRNLTYLSSSLYILYHIISSVSYRYHDTTFNEYGDYLSFISHSIYNMGKVFLLILNILYSLSQINMLARNSKIPFSEILLVNLINSSILADIFGISYYKLYEKRVELEDTILWAHIVRSPEHAKLLEKSIRDDIMENVFHEAKFRILHQYNRYNTYISGLQMLKNLYDVILLRRVKFKKKPITKPPINNPISTVQRRHPPRMLPAFNATLGRSPQSSMNHSNTRNDGAITPPTQTSEVESSTSPKVKIKTRGTADVTRSRDEQRSSSTSSSSSSSNQATESAIKNTPRLKDISVRDEQLKTLAYYRQFKEISRQDIEREIKRLVDNLPDGKDEPINGSERRLTWTWEDQRYTMKYETVHGNSKYSGRKLTKILNVLQAINLQSLDIESRENYLANQSCLGTLETLVQVLTRRPAI